MTFVLSKRSETILKSVHPDLAGIVRLAITKTKVDFRAIEGLRSLEKQRLLVNSGASQTMRSRHLTGHAVDLVALVNGEVRWDWPLYTEIAKAMKDAAKELDTPLEWGGDWKTFKDGPHYQLPWKDYP